FTFLQPGHMRRVPLPDQFDLLIEPLIGGPTMNDFSPKEFHYVVAFRATSPLHDRFSGCHNTRGLGGIAWSVTPHEFKLQSRQASVLHRTLECVGHEIIETTRYPENMRLRQVVFTKRCALDAGA